MGRVDKHRLEATTKQDIVVQQKADDVNALLDAAKFARRVRKRLGLAKLEFSHRIDVVIGDHPSLGSKDFDAVNVNL